MSADAGTRGIKDSRPTPQDRGTESAGDAGSSNGSLPSIGFFVYQVADERYAEAQNICPEPKTGLWQRTRFVANLTDLVNSVQTVATQFRIVRLGILAHGGKGGSITIGSDVIDLWTIDSFRSRIGQLRNYLTPTADIYLYGCVSARSKDGSVLLKEFSTILPGRRIIGFIVINVVNRPMRTSDIQKQHGKTCYDPILWCTSVTESTPAFTIENEATDSAPQAKIAQNGKVTKWPTYTNLKSQIFPEDPKTDDGTLKERAPFFKPSGK